MQKGEERKFPTWWEIEPPVRVKLMRELSDAVGRVVGGDGPMTDERLVRFERDAKFALRQLAKELQLKEIIL